MTLNLRSRSEERPQEVSYIFSRAGGGATSHLRETVIFFFISKMFLKNQIFSIQLCFPLPLFINWNQSIYSVTQTKSQETQTEWVSLSYHSNQKITLIDYTPGVSLLCHWSLKSAPAVCSPMILFSSTDLPVKNYLVVRNYVRHMRECEKFEKKGRGFLLITEEASKHVCN